MPRPLTVYKDGKSVPNVYPSEVQAWLDDGWALDPKPEPEQPKQESLVVEHSRQKELESLGWRDLKAIATEMGLNKEDDQQWDDLIPEILKLENR